MDLAESKKFLPSKRIVSVLIVIAALVASVIIAFGGEKSSSVINYASDLGTGDKVRIEENPNWQQELLNATQGTKLVATTTSIAPANLTDTVSQSLMANYLALKQSGLLDQESAQKLLDQTVNYIDNSSAFVAKLTQSDLNVVDDNGSQSIAAYGENLGNITKKRSRAQIEADLQLVLATIQAPTQDQINKLDSIVESYKQIETLLVKMPVPKTFIKAHLDIVNGLRGIIQAMTDLKSISDDPFRGLTAFQVYQQNLLTLSRALEATTTFIKQNNIAYKQGSGGYYLLYGI